MDGLRLEKQERGKYTMTIQDVVYELEMRNYTEDYGRTE